MDSINKTKIIFIVTQSEFGGAQRYIFELVSCLNPEKYEILVAAGHGDKELFKKVQNLPVKIFQLKHLKRNPNPLEAIFSISEMLGLLKKDRPKILFLCSTTAGILGSITASIYKLFKIHDSEFKIIYRIGGWAFHDPRPFWQNKIIFYLEKLTAGFKNKIIVNSEYDYQAAIKNKICSPEKIVKIHNGINPEKLEFLPKQEAKTFLFNKLPEYRIQDAKYIIGTVANFYRTKGIKYLIEGIKLLEAEYELLDVKCIVIGDGKQRPELEKLIEKHELKNKVFLVGRIPNAYRYLKAFDVFVLPSLKEGFPWIILEAMAAEIPIISTKVGALEEIIENNKQGILIEPKNAEELAENISKLIKNPELTQQFKEQAREKLKRFSLFNMVKQTEKLF
ncbi:MAG: glycosyltransferase [Candidatus Nealsonbacteria bacterium]